MNTHSTDDYSPDDSDFDDNDDVSDSESSSNGEDGLCLNPGDRPVPGQDWVLIKQIGSRSGFGQVWLAKDEAMQSFGVFKFCKNTTDLDSVAGLHNEVDKLRAVSHNGIVRLVAASLRASPPFLQYEYVPDSFDLKVVLENYTARYGSVDPHDASRVVLSISETLAHCHTSTPPLIHRDLKPANILVLDYGLLELAQAMNVPPRLGDLRFKLLDFGIASRARSERDDAEHEKSLGRNFDGIGTRGYKSPQQRYGKPDYRPSTTDDVYSLGVIWWQMVTGLTPLPDATNDDFQDGLAEASLPDELKHILLRCLIRTADQRIQSADVLVRMLSDVLGATRSDIREVLREQAVDDIVDLSSLTRLTENVARSIGPVLNKSGVRLDGLNTLSPSAAKALVAGGMAYISLGSSCLKSPLSVAQSLAAESIGTLRLDGLGPEGVTPAVAEALICHDSLTLNGLTELSADVAKVFGRWSGRGLWLGGLSELSLDAAAALSAARGTLHLGLRHLSPSLPEVLFTRPNRSRHWKVNVMLKGTMEVDVFETCCSIAGRQTRIGEGDLWSLRPSHVGGAPKLLYTLFPENLYWLDLSDITVLPLGWATFLTKLYRSSVRIRLPSLSLKSISFEVAEVLGRFAGHLDIKDFKGDASQLPKAVEALWSKRSDNG